MVYYHSLAYKLKMAPFLIDRIQQVHILAHTKDTPEAQTPSQLPRHNKTPIRGLVLRLAAVGCFVLVLSNRLCRRLPHLRFRDNQNHHCFAHRNRLLFIVAHVLGASAAASSFRNFVHLSRPPFVEYRFKACAQPFHPIPLLLLL